MHIQQRLMERQFNDKLLDVIYTVEYCYCGYSTLKGHSCCYYYEVYI